MGKIYCIRTVDRHRDVDLLCGDCDLLTRFVCLTCSVCTGLVAGNDTFFTDEQFRFSCSD